MLDQVDQAKNISAQGSLQMKGNLDTLASLKTSLAKVSTAPTDHSRNVAQW